MKKIIILIIILFCGTMFYIIMKNPRNIDLFNNRKGNYKEQGIAVLNYHFFYDESKGEKCGQSICIEKKEFEKQLNYLKTNGYKTLTIKEFKEWMYKEIELPEKSVLITIDDGAKGTGTNDGNILIPLLEKYDMNATLFLITTNHDTKYFLSKRLDLQSHGNNIHENGDCGKAKIECYSKAALYDDIKVSIERVQDNTSFCFPFYITNMKAEEVLQELGIKIAFVGGDKKAYRSNEKYKISRFKMYNTIDIDDFSKMLES